MGTKTHNNYEDLITFTRASAGHALRPVSYGTELVTNGNYSDGTTGWTNDSSLTMDTFEVASGRLHIANTAGTTQAAYTDDNISLVAGKIYKFTAELEKVSGNDNWDIDIRVAALSTVRYTMTSTATTETLQVIFVATQTENTVIQITTRDTFEGYIDNVSVKEVTFDQPDGTLTLFEHPDNVPRVEYDADGNRLGLLVEESRTNRVQYSTPDSNWNTSTLGTGVTPVVTLNNETSPDGTTSAAKVVLDVGGGTTSGDRSLFLVPTANVTATNSYAGSVWLKGETGGEQVVMRHAGNATYSLFTLTTSWARYDVTETAASSLATMAIGLKGNQSDATATIYVWGAQIEEGSFPTSTIVNNSGSTATRSADVAELDQKNFGSNLNAGAIFYEGQDIADNYSGAINSGGGFHVWFGGDGSNYVGGLYHSPSSGLTSSVYYRGSATTEIVNSGTAMSGNGKVAIAYDLGNSISVSVDGGTAVTQTATAPTAYDNFDWKIRLGSGTAGSTTNTSVYVKQLKFYPRRLTNAQLQDLTS